MVLLLGTIGPPLRGADLESETWLLTRTLQGDQVRIPCVFAPARLEHPLQIVDALIDIRDTAGASAALRRTLESLSGRLLPPIETTNISRPWARVPPPSEVLRGWQRQNSRILDLEFTPWARGTESSYAAETHPVMWHRDAQLGAIAAFERAVEAAEWGRAWRLLETIPRERVPARLEALIASGARTWSPIGALRPPATEQLAARVPKSLERRLSVPMDRDRDLRPQPDHPSGLRTRVNYRLSPGGSVFPLIGSHEVVFAVGPRVLAIDPRPPARILWDTRPSEETAPASALTHRPSGPIAIPGGFLAPERRMLAENPLLIPTSHRGVTGWTSWRGYRLIFEQPPAPMHNGVTRFLNTVRAAGNVIAAPWVDPEVVAVLTVEGWEELEFKLHAGSSETGTPLWVRSLGSAERPWLAANDLRSLLPPGHIDRVGDDLIVTPGSGWLARVDRKTGDYRGVLFYERIDEEAEPSQPVHTFERTRFREVTAPGSRPVGARSWVSSPEDRPLYVVLPADGSHLLGIDVARWQVQWAHGPIGPEAQLVTVRGGRCFVLDLQVPTSATTVRGAWVDGATGRLEGVCDLTLTGPGRAPNSDESDSDRDESSPRDPVAADDPILSGSPIATAEQLWIPGRTALMAWDWARLDHPDDRAMAPQYATTWPAGSVGGTTLPLDGGALICFSRGFVREGTGPVIEVFARGEPSD